MEDVPGHYKISLLEAVSKLECKGRISYYSRNLFTYARISDEFSYLATEILAPLGFTLVPLMHKDFSPKTHISLLNNYEQDFVVQRVNVDNTYRKWESKEITFKIEEVAFSKQRDKNTGLMKNVCMLRVSSTHIEEIREDLFVDPLSEYYSCHIKLCENFE